MKTLNPLIQSLSDFRFDPVKQPHFPRTKSSFLGIMVTATILTLITGFSPVNLAIANEQHNLIARNMIGLQQSSERWILIDLSGQRLIAWEGNQPVYAVIVSTGKADTPTRTGVFKV